jgi:proprotein convertase subtilisin/kexin type 5
MLRPRTDSVSEVCLCTMMDPCIISFVTSRSCSQFSFNTTCLASCPANTYDVPITLSGGIEDICLACDEQCVGCSGEGPSQCRACRAAKLGDTCVSACPVGTYRSVLGVCEACSSLCDGACSGAGPSQCTGNSSNPFGCRYVYDPSTASCTTSCRPLVEFRNPVTSSCAACMPTCSGCTGPSQTDCVACVDGMFYDQALQRCVACDGQCANRACNGPSAGNCTQGCQVR